MRVDVGIAALAVMFSGVGCKRPNGAYCDDARPCPNGFACDLVARECHAVLSGGNDIALALDMADCACSGSTPICVAMTCVSCLSTSDPDAACAATSPSTPFCETTDSKLGACVACRDSSDCGGATPFCDPNTKSCRGCISDSECPSYVCELTPDSTNHGLCIPTSQVEYVDGKAATNGDGLTLATPRQKIQDAVNHATGGDNRQYVHVAAATYDENVGVSNGAAIYIVGEDGATIRPTNGDGVGAFSGGSLTVRNIVAAAPSGNASNCQNASFIAYRSQFIDSKQSGVYAQSCALLLDACWIDSNSQGGVYIGGGNFQILNSIITNNSNSGGLYQVGTGTTTFTNNTVADNTAGGIIGGVACSATSSLIIRNSILYNDKGSGGATVAETNCMSASSASDDPASGSQSTVNLTNTNPGFKGGGTPSADSYHLSPTSPCLDKASPTFAPDHDFDFERRPDLKTMAPDIGADEVQQ